MRTGQKAFALSGAFGLGSVVGELGTAVFDPDTKYLWMGMRVTNIGNRVTNFTPNLTLRGNGDDITTSLGAGGIPPGVPIDITAEFSGVGSFDPTNTELLVSRPELNQQIIPLGPGAKDKAHVDLPRDVDVPAPLHVGRFEVQPTSARLLAGTPDGTIADAGKRVLVIGFDVHVLRHLANIYGFFPTEFFKLGLPDGTAVEPLSGSDGIDPYSNTDWTDFSVAFPVPDPPAGTYKLILQNRTMKTVSGVDPKDVRDATSSFTVGDGAEHWTLTTPPALPEIPVRQGPGSDPKNGVPGTTIPLPSIDRAIDRGSFTYGGQTFTPRRLHWDADSRKIVIDVDVENLTHEDVAFSGTVNAVWGNHSVEGGLDSNDRMKPGATMQGHLTFAGVDRFDADRLWLLTGRGDKNRSVFALSDGAGVVANPMNPVASDQPGSAQTGSWKISAVKTRVGSLQPGFAPPANKTTVAVDLDVTALVEDKKGLGLHGQVFLRTPDGLYLEAAHNDTKVDGNPTAGLTQHTWTDFSVPLPIAGDYQLVLRSVDEVQTFNRPNNWTEVSLPLHLG